MCESSVSDVVAMPKIADFPYTNAQARGCQGLLDTSRTSTMLFGFYVSSIGK